MVALTCRGICYCNNVSFWCPLPCIIESSERSKGGHVVSMNAKLDYPRRSGCRWRLWGLEDKREQGTNWDVRPLKRLGRRGSYGFREVVIWAQLPSTAPEMIESQMGGGCVVCVKAGCQVLWPGSHRKGGLAG